MSLAAWDAAVAAGDLRALLALGVRPGVLSAARVAAIGAAIVGETPVPGYGGNLCDILVEDQDDPVYSEIAGIIMDSLWWSRYDEPIEASDTYVADHRRVALSFDCMWHHASRAVTDLAIEMAWRDTHPPNEEWDVEEYQRSGEWAEAGERAVDAAWEAAAPVWIAILSRGGNPFSLPASPTEETP